MTDTCKCDFSVIDNTNGGKPFYCTECETPINMEAYASSATSEKESEVTDEMITELIKLVKEGEISTLLEKLEALRDLPECKHLFLGTKFTVEGVTIERCQRCRKDIVTKREPKSRESEWISVEDKLPEGKDADKGGMVLVWDKTKKYSTSAYYKQAKQFSFWKHSPLPPPSK